MKKLLKALESASIELGHLTEPPWCAYTECVARIRDEVREVLAGLKPMDGTHEQLKSYGEKNRQEGKAEALKGNGENAAECRGRAAAYLHAAELIYRAAPWESSEKAPDRDKLRMIRDVALQEGDWAVECSNPGVFLKVHPDQFGQIASGPAYSFFRENSVFTHPSAAGEPEHP